MGCVGFFEETRDSFDGRSGVASEIKLRDLIFLLERLNGLSPEERTVQFPGLPKNRADILPAGLTVVVEWMRFMKQDFLIHSFRNLRLESPGIFQLRKSVTKWIKIFGFEDSKIS